MKRFIIFNLMVISLLFGCKPDSSVISPDETISQKQVKLIHMPAPKYLSLETVYTESMYINGYNGGTFAEQFSYQSTNGTVIVNSQLVFPSYSFSGGKTITQTFNTETASLEFGPAMQFNNPVKYTLTVSGLDLSNVNPNTLDFVYVAQDGTITGVVYDSISMNVSTGTLKVVNAQLNHFSRYGFVN
jgi:hypothetical protein